MRAADSHDLLRVHGARVDNPRDVTLEVPQRRLTVFTVVPGSGRSSLVLGTLPGSVVHGTDLTAVHDTVGR